MASSERRERDRAAERRERERADAQSWRLSEMLVLCQAVLKYGENDWSAVSKAVRGKLGPERDHNNYIPRRCQAKYQDLQKMEVQNLALSTRKRRGYGDADKSVGISINEQITDRMRHFRMIELKKIIQDLDERIKVLKVEMVDIQEGKHDDRIQEILEDLEAEQKSFEEAEKAALDTPGELLIREILAEQGQEQHVRTERPAPPPLYIGAAGAAERRRTKQDDEISATSAPGTPRLSHTPKRPSFAHIYPRSFEGGTPRQDTLELGRKQLWATEARLSPLMRVLKIISSHKFAPPFKKPVLEEEAPGYHAFIKRPMDLGTLKKNVEVGVINTYTDFNRDLMLIFNNAMKYNEPGSEIFNMAKVLKQVATVEMAVVLREEQRLQEEMSSSTPTLTPVYEQHPLLAAGSTGASSTASPHLKSSTPSSPINLKKSHKRKTASGAGTPRGSSSPLPKRPKQATTLEREEEGGQDEEEGDDDEEEGEGEEEEPAGTADAAESSLKMKKKKEKTKSIKDTQELQPPTVGTPSVEKKKSHKKQTKHPKERTVFVSTPRSETEQPKEKKSHHKKSHSPTKSSPHSHISPPIVGQVSGASTPHASTPGVKRGVVVGRGRGDGASALLRGRMSQEKGRVQRSGERKTRRKSSTGGHDEDVDVVGV